jgi:hypothetical protein
MGVYFLVSVLSASMGHYLRRPELVEGLSFFVHCIPQEGQSFDKLRKAG